MTPKILPTTVLLNNCHGTTVEVHNKKNIPKPYITFSFVLLSYTKYQPTITVNSANIPIDLLESAVLVNDIPTIFCKVSRKPKVSELGELIPAFIKSVINGTNMKDDSKITRTAFLLKLIIVLFIDCGSVSTYIILIIITQSIVIYALIT